jgi:hypothetical protein
VRNSPAGSLSISSLACGCYVEACGRVAEHYYDVIMHLQL